MNSTEQSIQNEDLAEEIDAINAIYEPSTITITNTTATVTASSSTDANPAFTSDSPITTTIILQIPNHPHISFLLGFDAEYPTTPPRIIGPASSQSRGESKKWVDILSTSVEKVHIEGSVCLYDLIEEAGERFGEVKATEIEQEPPSFGTTGKGQNTSAHDASENTSNTETPGKTLLSSYELEDPPEWTLSDPISEKKSVFVARAVKVQSREQAENYLNYLLATEKKVASATHNITAWRIRQKEQRKSDGTTVKVDTTVQDFDDDGETAAGGRLLHLMQLMDVWDVVVVVTRWYGGVKLGPDRFRIINAAGRDALIKGGFSRQDSTDGQDKGKKKGKRKSPDKGRPQGPSARIQRRSAMKYHKVAPQIPAKCRQVVVKIAQAVEIVALFEPPGTSSFLLTTKSPHLLSTMTGNNSYLEYKRDTAHLLYWMLHAYNKVVESTSSVHQVDDLFPTTNTTGEIRISALVPIAKLIAKHIDTIPSTIYRLFKSTIAARIATHEIFQQMVSNKPDPEIEKSNVTHKHFIDTLTEAFEVLGGEEWASRPKTETPRGDSGIEGTDDGDNYEDIFSNKFALLDLDGDKEVVEDGPEEEPHHPLGRTAAKPTRKGKKCKRGKKAGRKSKSSTKKPSLDDVPLERYRFTEEGSGSINEYLMAVYSLVKQWMELRHYIQELWREVAYGNLNSAVASALSHMGVAMVKTAQTAIFTDFPEYDFYEIIMLTATRGDPEDAEGMFRNTHRHTREDGTEEVKDRSIDIKEQFLVNCYLDLLAFATDFQQTRSGKPTKSVLPIIRDWDPSFDLQTATKEERLKWRSAYTVNWLYDLVNVFSCIVVQQINMRGQKIVLEDVDWSINGPWDDHRTIFGLSEFAAEITSFAMKKPGTDIRRLILPHHVFQLQIIVDSFMTSRGWMIHNIKGDILEPPATEFRAPRDVDIFLDRKNERVRQGYCYAVEELTLLLEEDAMLHGNPRRHDRERTVLRGLRDDFLYWLGESKHKYGLATIAPSRFSNSDTNGLWEYSPFLCGAGLMEALELAYSSNFMMWDRIPEPMCAMHLHNMLLQKGYLKEEVTMYSTLQMLFQREFFIDGKPPTSNFCRKYLEVYGEDGYSRCPTFKRQYPPRRKFIRAVGIHAMVNLNGNGTFRQKSLLTLFREANWIPERIPDGQLPLATTLGLLRMGQVKPTIDPATGKKVLKDTPLINRARSEGVLDEAIIHMAGVLNERNTDMARIQAKKRARYFARNPDGVGYIPPPPLPEVSDDSSINIIPGSSEMLRVLKWDFISDVCGKLRPLSSVNYVSMTARFMLFFTEVEAELKRRNNPTWRRAYVEESMLMQEKRASLTMLVLEEQDGECMRVMADVLERTPVGFMNHVYWDDLESHESVVNKLENKGPEYDHSGPPCMMQ